MSSDNYQQQGVLFEGSVPLPLAKSVTVFISLPSAVIIFITALFAS